MTDAEKIRVLREALTNASNTLAKAFGRIHCLPRTSDTELADRIEKERAAITLAISTTEPAPRDSSVPGEADGFDPAGNSGEDLLRRAAVVALLKQRAMETADQAIFGEPGNSRNREAMEAAFNQAAYAVVFMPPDVPADPPCSVCGNEERGHGGYLTCECPAPQPAVSTEGGE